jgi:transposase-like protein
MSKTRRKFTRELKVAAVKRLQGGYPVGRVARELEVNPSQLQLWKRQFQERPNSAFSGEGRKRTEETQVAELERKIGQQAMEIDFLKGCLRQIEDLRRSQAETASPRSAGKSGTNGKGVAR